MHKFKNINFTLSKIILPLFLICFTAVADDKLLSNCEEQGNSFGDGRGASKIQAICVETYKKMASANSNKKNQDGQMLAFGHKNIVFIERPDKKGQKRTDVIAGLNTNLEMIVALAIDEKNNEIAVLEKSGDILFFSTTIMGNVAPFRILKSPDLFGATDIAIDTKNDQVVVINNSKNSILFYSRLANINAREGKKKLEMIRKIDDTSGSLQKIAIDEEKQELSVFDQKNEKVLVYKLSK